MTGCFVKMGAEYAKKDERIRVIHKKNGGLSDARNAGIKIAKGKYITFNSEIKEVTYIEDNSALEKLTIWENKMRTLGVLDDYIISSDKRTLLKYKGTDSKVSLPPVRVLIIHDASVTIKELKIPSTVEYISGIRPSVLNIDFSKATNLHLVGNANGFVTEDKRIITQNILFEKVGDLVSLGLNELGGELEIPALQLSSISYQDRSMYALIKIHDRKEIKL